MFRAADRLKVVLQHLDRPNSRIVSFSELRVLDCVHRIYRRICSPEIAVSMGSHTGRSEALKYTGRPRQQGLGNTAFFTLIIH